MSRQHLSEPTIRFRLFFGKQSLFFLICFTILLNNRVAEAFFSNDRIDEDFSYRSLRVEMPEADKRGCYLEGEILNNTSMTQEGVSITFYAYDFFDHVLWKEAIRIDIIDPYYRIGKGHAFRKKLHSCQMPAKFQFKVSGVKGKDANKAVKNKSKSKKSGN